MRTPPDDLDAADLATVLAVGWGLHHVALTYAPVGFGGHHWVAAVAGRPAWFVTAAPPVARLAAAFATAVALRDAGLDFVVAPVATGSGALTESYRGHAVSLTPWCADAQDHPGSGPEVVAVAVALHGATNAAQGVARRDDLRLDGRAALDHALATVARPWSGGPYADGLQALLRPAAARVTARLRAFDAAAAGVDRDRFVVTHGELKAGNLLTTPGGLALVDWDTALLAPPERDLWRLADDDLAAYADRCGRRPDPAVLALYRERWDLTDLALYVRDLRRAPARTADTEVAWEVVHRLLS